MDEIRATDTAKRRGPLWQGVSTAALAAIVIVVGLLGGAYYDEQVRVVDAHKAGELQSIAALKVAEIVDWRERILIDGRLIRESARGRSDLAVWVRDPRTSREASSIVAWMDATVRILGYDDAVLVSSDGARLGTAGSQLDTGTVDALSRVLASAEPKLTDLHVSSQGRPQLELLVPLPATGIGAAEMRHGPHPRPEPVPLPARAVVAGAERQCRDPAGSP